LEIYFTGRFTEAYEKLSKIDKKAVRKSLPVLEENLSSPGLFVKKIEGRPDIYEARCNINVRLTFQIDKNQLILRNVGSQDNILKKP
jgi:mRNA interferase RelE/StbE